MLSSALEAAETARRRGHQSLPGHRDGEPAAAIGLATAICKRTHERVDLCSLVRDRDRQVILGAWLNTQLARAKPLLWTLTWVGHVPLINAPRVGNAL